MKNVLIACLLSCSMTVAMGQYTISGTVMDDSGNALPGATIALNNGIGTVSDSDGNYFMDRVTAGEYKVAVSYVGYEAYSSSITVDSDATFDFNLKQTVFIGDEVIVTATRAGSNTPSTKITITKEEIAERNLGQDLPILLNYTPSIVTTTDAGAGIGYTGMRIRGSDATRINVTVNGVPLNDPESHGVWWVNMPDFASSVNSIQIQRGVGTSSNGAGAFGATINMETSGATRDAFVKVENSHGSFNTWKHNVVLNSGLLNKRFNFEGRLSKISSDGYIDRASANLNSFFLSGGYYGDRTTIKAMVFGGEERTYQAWYGTPGAKLYGNAEDLQTVIDLGGEYGTQEQVDNLLDSDRRFNYYLYENEVDNYGQNHYQLHLNHYLNDNLNLAGALHYTKGAGYFEQFRNDDPLAQYNLPDVILTNDTISSTNLVRRRWLDNDFYGFTYAINYDNDALDLSIGGAYNIYDGDHFGEIIWAEFASNYEPGDKYYDGNGLKKDFNVFMKGNYSLTDDLSLFGDIQLRSIDYVAKGVDNDLVSYDTGDEYLFVNPKAGFNYQPNGRVTIYGLYAIGNREPVRSDFIDAPNGITPMHETLQNVELGLKGSGSDLMYEANIYLMDYKNQLVLTGALNDVGAAIRTNTPDSYRAGIELVAGYQIAPQLSVSANLTLSKNKIKNFTEIQYDYAYTDERYIVTIEHENTDISFSPSVISGGQLDYAPFRGFNLQILGKYVGQQFLDNTSNEERAINSYFVSDVRMSYDFSVKGIDNIAVNLLVNNVLNKLYESNGYTWGYLWEGWLYQQNNYYPQAGTNFLLGLSLKF
ncbi:MAG: TonB-dependent receptor [Cyclobacteriaceae bacterium]